MLHCKFGTISPVHIVYVHGSQLILLFPYLVHLKGQCVFQQDASFIPLWAREVILFIAILNDF